MGHRVDVTILGGRTRSIPLTGDRLSLGRSDTNELSYPTGKGISRHHVALERAGDEWYVRDLGSKNGTILNGEQITGQVLLQPGDRISVGHVTLVFEKAEELDADCTVTYVAEQDITDKPPTHTVTLGELLPDEERDSATVAAEGGAHWTDPVTALVRAGRELVARKPMKVLFRDILTLSLEAVGAGRGVLLALENDQLEVQASEGDEFNISDAVRDRVMIERSSLLISDAMSDDVLRVRQSIVKQEVHSLMAVPLQTDERVLGLIYVDTPRYWRQFTRADLNLLTIMANVAAMRIEQERLAAAEQERRLWEHELEQAAEIQQQFLPRQAPLISGLELAGYNRACYSVGGDYYDFVEHPDGKVIVALGDVAGKGMPAALLMVSLQARMQMLAEQPGGPASMVTHLNRVMKAVCPANRFITFFLCHIDPASGELDYCNAGHNPPYLVRAGGEVEELEGGGPVLGILPGVTYEQRTCRMEPGDMIVIFSDGVTEAVNPRGDEFGEQRLIDVLLRNRNQPADEVSKAINRALHEFVAGARATDDVTLVVARRTV